jgi:pyruvate dehydrogenase E2 component (dihydrolipoamide acetyltransferase)
VAKNVVMPALGMAQETGTLIAWRKSPGDTVTKGDILMEVETDKATVEVEAAASGILSNVTASPGDVIPVGQTIALILAPGEQPPALPSPSPSPAQPAAAPAQSSTVISATPVAQRVAAEHGLDLSQVKPASGSKIQKEDVLAYIAASGKAQGNGKVLASPKARRLAAEHGLELKAIHGSGPNGAVLAADVLNAALPSVAQSDAIIESAPVSRLWQIMAERVTQAWTTIPHFYLLREVNAAALTTWLAEVRARAPEKITFTDLLVKLTASALGQHPRLNASWHDSVIALNREINIGIAVAFEDGLVVPVIRHSDSLGLGQIATRRIALVAKANTGKLSPDDIGGGTFTISNLGMYGVDAFNAIVNPPQAAILAVSRIADRVVPVNGQPAVQPMLTLSLSCDHRVVDGARGAQFLATLADLIENPLRLWD